MGLRVVLWQGTYEKDHEDEVGAPSYAVDEDWGLEGFVSWEFGEAIGGIGLTIITMKKFQSQ